MGRAPFVMVPAAWLTEWRFWALPEPALRLHLAAHLHATVQSTDGRIEAGAVAHLAAVSRADEAALGALLSGFWRRDGDDYQLTDFVGRPAEALLRERELARTRQERRRSRPMSRVTSTVTNGAGHDAVTRESRDKSKSKTQYPTGTSSLPGTAIPPPASAREAREGYEAFMSTLASVTGRSFRPTNGTRSRYLERLDEGYTPDDLLAAARGVEHSPHHKGNNRARVALNDPKHVLGSDMLDALIGLGRGEIAATKSSATHDEQRQSEIDRWAAEGGSK